VCVGDLFNRGGPERVKRGAQNGTAGKERRARSFPVPVLRKHGGRWDASLAVEGQPLQLPPRAGTHDSKQAAVHLYAYQQAPASFPFSLPQQQHPQHLPPFSLSLSFRAAADTIPRRHTQKRPSVLPSSEHASIYTTRPPNFSSSFASRSGAKNEPKHESNDAVTYLLRLLAPFLLDS
jgi:hypothetical protein